PARPLRGGDGTAARLCGGGAPTGRGRAGPRGADVVPVQQCRGDGAEPDHPLRGAEPGGGRAGDGGGLLPPGWTGEGGGAERRSGYRDDGAGEWLLPLAGASAPRVREGGAEAAVPAVRGDKRHGRGRGELRGGAVRPALP